MDQLRFLEACRLGNGKPDDLSGMPIGMLGEKTLHSVLKNYFEPDRLRQEIRIGGFFADILGDSGIIEIQTKQFYKLAKKLAYFLEEYQVTLVYPVAETKWLSWIDASTGETTKKRKSPKIGKPYEIFPELYAIRHFLTNPNLRICVVLLRLEEFRLLNGWSIDKKRGSTRYERIPRELVDELYINDSSDYTKLIPEFSSASFTSRDFSQASGLSMKNAQTALNVLCCVGAVERIGKKGRLFVYERAGASNSRKDASV
jgi:hypothetical protein